MSPRRNIPVTEVEALLLAEGRTLAECGLTESGLPLIRTATGWKALPTREDALHLACARYLRQRGARVVPKAEVRGPEVRE